MIRRAALFALLLTSAALPAGATPPAPTAPAPVEAGLLPITLDRAGGKILATLPAPSADGVSGRYLYVASLRTGIDDGVNVFRSQLFLTDGGNFEELEYCVCQSVKNQNKRL